jgi:hypothetical protein
VHQLVDEHGRDVDRRLEQAHVAALDRARVEQLLAELQHHAVVVPGVFVFHRRELFFGNRRFWRCHERRMQRSLALARLVDRMDLRAQVVRAEEIVGDPQPPGRVAL